jgi:hypothetical protein
VAWGQVRLLVIYYLCTPSVSDADAAEYTAALAALGVDAAVMTYLQHLRKMKQLSSRASAMSGAAPGRGGGAGGLSLTDILSKVHSLPLQGAADPIHKRGGGAMGTLAA